MHTSQEANLVQKGKKTSEAEADCMLVLILFASKS